MPLWPETSSVALPRLTNNDLRDADEATTGPI